jgi:hypothetical protein
VALSAGSHLGLVFLDSPLPRHVRITLLAPAHPCLRSIHLAVVRDAAAPQ